MTGFEEHKSNIEMLSEICGENKDINLFSSFILRIK